MAKLECDFFPGVPAAWGCTSCNTHYSEKCIPAGHSRYWGSVRPACLRCRGQLEYLGRATDAKPFWQMMPHFLNYPLHTNSLIVIGVLAVGVFFVPRNILAIAVILLAATVVVRYSFAILQSRAQGDTTAPALSAVLSTDENGLFWQLLVLLLAISGITYTLSNMAAFLGFVASLFFTLAMPACIMVLAVEKSVSRALDPAVLTTLMRAVGWPYLLLWFCTQLIYAGPMYLIGWLAEVMPLILVLPMVVASMVYFSFVLFTMLGYVLFEYQHELGFEIPEEDEEMDRTEFEKAKAQGEVTVLIKDGKYKDAREIMRGALDVARNDLELHQHYHKLLMLMDDDQALVNHGIYLIDLLKQDNQWSKAVQIFLDVQSRVPGFQLQDTRAALEIAKLLRLQGKHKAVVRLFHNLHKRKARDPLVPAAYLMVAQIFFENLNDHAKALALIQFVLKHYPQCPEREELLQLQNIIDQTSTV